VAAFVIDARGAVATGKVSLELSGVDGATIIGEVDVRKIPPTELVLLLIDLSIDVARAFELYNEPPRAPGSHRS
jgi:hypothetical protein